MCYMGPRVAGRVGVRELRQNLSVYLERVKAGELLEVTERGAPVALLSPVPGPWTAVERLIAAGHATPATGDVLELGPPLGRRVTRRASKALRALRQDGR
jgi:prevent-host-death family protein